MSANRLSTRIVRSARGLTLSVGVCSIFISVAGCSDDPDGVSSDAGRDGGNEADAGMPCSGPEDCFMPAAPICDTATGTCRGCEPGAGDCAEQRSETPHCAPALGSFVGRCLECYETAHCEGSPAGRICDPGTHTCRPCEPGSSDCAALAAERPVCVPQSADARAGQCVQCLDSVEHCALDPSKPICDEATARCRGCREHTECQSPVGAGICLKDTGACLVEDEVWYVDDNTCPALGDGSEGNPFCSLRDAVEAVTPGRSTVYVRMGTYEDFPISIGGDFPVWIVGGPGAQILVRDEWRSAVSIFSPIQVSLDGLSIRGEDLSRSGVECLGNVASRPTVTVRDSHIEGFLWGGVRADHCTLTLIGNAIVGNDGGGVISAYGNVVADRNVIRGNLGGGMSLYMGGYADSYNFRITNNVIALNGSVGSEFGGVELGLPGLDSVFAFNTVMDNASDVATASGVHCTETTSIDNSVLHGNEGGDFSSLCDVVHGWTSADGDPLLVGSGDYHLAPGSPCIDAGDPAATLDHDIDGQSRPQGTAPDIGADEAG